MNRSERTALLYLLLLLTLGFLLWRIFAGHKPSPPAPTAPPVISSTTPAALKTFVTPPKPKSPHTLPVTGPPGAPGPPTLQLHKELIPKNIEIVRCYYTQEIAPPGVTFGFDLNGSGFTNEFEKMIKVESGVDHIRVKNLHLITANQIHGEMEVGAQAKTTFVYPRVLIKGLPVFSAPEPFAIVRKGGVLTVFFISMEETGRAGRFRVITNLDEDLAKQFQILPSTPGIEISDLQAHLPYAMEGRLQISPGVPTGDYGLAISIAGKEAFRRGRMIRIVRPNVGQSGFVQGVVAAEKFHRPGDPIQLYLQGTGLTPPDIQTLQAKVDEFDIGQASFTHISGAQMRFTFDSPPEIPPGSYGVTVLGAGGKTLFQKKDVFKIVSPNWVAGVQVTPPVKAGGKSALKVIGRDFSEEFAQGFRIEVDEPGITITDLRKADASTLLAEISVSSGVAPGDYWLHLSAPDQKIEPPYGSIIKVESP